MGLFDTLNSFMTSDTANSLAGAGALHYLMEDQKKDLTNIGNQALTGANAIGQQAYTDTQFKPFSVVSGTGSNVNFDANGGLNAQLSGAEQNLYNQNLQGATNMLGAAANGNTTTRAQEIYDLIRNTQRPEEDRNRLALESRLAAQGRLGTRTDAFGGTPEALAFEKARAEADNQAMLGALGQAGQERMQDFTIGQGLLGAAYQPINQLMQMTNPALNAANIANTNQRQAANLRAEAGMTGLDAKLQSGLGAANLGGNYMSALASILGANSNREANEGTLLGNIWSTGAGLFEDFQGTDLYGKILDAIGL